jgi:hypothetical protein
VAGKLDAAHARHLHIEQDDVGLVLGHGVERIARAAGLADDVVRAVLGNIGQQRPQAVARKRFVVNDQYPRFHAGVFE